MDTMKSTFNDNNLIDLDQDADNNTNNKSLEESKIELENNFSLVKNRNDKNEKQEIEVFVKNNRHLSFRDYEFDEPINESNYKINDNDSYKNFLTEDILSANYEKNSKKVIKKNNVRTNPMHHQNKANIFLYHDQEDDGEKFIIEKSSVTSEIIKAQNATTTTSINDNNYVEKSNNDFSRADSNKINQTITETNNNSEKNQSINKAELNPGEVYYFMNNITQYEYSGRWKGCNPNNMFEQAEGGMSMEIRKNQSQQVYNVIPNIQYFRILELTFNAKDGDYRDNWMVFNFTLKFPRDFNKNFMSQKEEINSENNSTAAANANVSANGNYTKNIKQNANRNSIILIEDKVQIRYYIAELFETKNITQCNNSRVELEFVRAPIFRVENFDDINSVEFSKINGKITDPDCDFNFDFNLKIETEEVLFLLYLILYVLNNL